MIRTLIVDDDSLIHVTLRSLIDWEDCGYTVVQNCSGGNQALGYLMEHPVDLLITVEGVGLVSGRNYSINRVYDLAVNSARGYYTRTSQFTGTVTSID